MKPEPPAADRLPVGERVRVRLLSADPAAGIRFQLLAAS